VDGSTDGHWDQLFKVDSTTIQITTNNETKAWFKGILCHYTRKLTGPTLQIPEPIRGINKTYLQQLIFKQNIKSMYNLKCIVKELNHTDTVGRRQQQIKQLVSINGWILTVVKTNLLTMECRLPAGTLPSRRKYVTVGSRALQAITVQGYNISA